MTKKELLLKYPSLKVPNSLEFKQRLAWLSEGMLHNHINGVVNYEVNMTEIEDYTEFEKGYKRSLLEKASDFAWIADEPNSGISY